MQEKSRHFGPLGAALLAPALLLLVALLAGTASAQTQAPPDVTVYHSLDPEGDDPRPEHPPGCTPGSTPGGGGGGDSGYDSYYDSGFDSGGGSGGGPGGWVIVVGDINAGSNPAFYTNLLEGDTQVLAGRGSTGSNAAVVAHYQSLPGVTTTVTNTTIGSGELAGMDLLIFNQPNFDLAMVYTPGELSAIGDFVRSGGNLLLIAETNTHHANFNAFLTGVGTSLQYSLEGRSAGGATIVPGAPFTAGVATFSQSAYNLLLGGEPVVIESAGLQRAIVAAEQIGGGGPGGEPVPDCVLGGESYEEFSLWIDGGPAASGVEELLCNRDEAEGGSGHELCGAQLTFQIEGIGRFRKAIPDPDMDTLVLGESCLPTEGLGCIFETQPPVTLLRMNFLRGANPLAAGPRRIGSLIVDSTGLDPTNNFTAITVFGDSAGAQLQLRPIGTGVDPVVLADSRLTPIPEPGQLAQLVSGLFGLAGLQRLRRRH